MSARRRQPGKKDESALQETRAHSSFWSGTITFGLVSIPVDFYAATHPSGSGLRMVTKEGHLVGKRYICPRHERPISSEEIVRGFQIESGEFVPITDEELESVAPEKTRDIELKRFVSRADLPVLLFSRPYVLAPGGGSNKAYRLLAETMQQSGHAGIATFVMRDKAYIVAILAENGVMRAETLRFSDELRTPESIGLPKPPRISTARTEEALAAIERLTRDELDLEQLSDRQGIELEKLVKDKLKRGSDVFEVEAEAPSETDSPVEAPIDLVALLKRRLERSADASDRQRASSRSEVGTSLTTADLEEKPKRALYERAKTLGINGRSTMTKKDLARAIQKAAG